MSTEAEVTRELDNLAEESPRLQALCMLDKDATEFGARYQQWYSRAVKLVGLLGPDRLEEFCSYYRIDPKRKSVNALEYTVQDFVNHTPSPFELPVLETWNRHAVVAKRIEVQGQILSSLRSRLGTVLADVRGHLLAELEDEELATAERLLKLSVRAAGAVAGVVLERHLQQVAANHQVSLSRRDPSISELNGALRAAAVYDLPVSRKIDYLGDIRNLCDHKKTREPNKDEVSELIAGVVYVIKSIH